MFDDDRRRAVHQLKEPAAFAIAVSMRGVFSPAHSADIPEHVVSDNHVAGLLARPEVIPPENIDARRGVPHDVVRERYVFDSRPGTAPILIPRREENLKTDLLLRPIAYVIPSHVESQ